MNRWAIFGAIVAKKLKVKADLQRRKICRSKKGVVRYEFATILVPSLQKSKKKMQICHDRMESQEVSVILEITSRENRRVSRSEHNFRLYFHRKIVNLQK